MDEEDHKQLHRTQRPPKKPSRDEMLNAIWRCRNAEKKLPVLSEMSATNIEND